MLDDEYESSCCLFLFPPAPMDFNLDTSAARIK